jgi:hypothetical protein
MEFRLTYQGLLLAETTRSGEVRRARANHKHEIRKAFHPQLKQWWSISPYLRPRELKPQPGRQIFGRPAPEHTLEGLSKRFERFGYSFVPLVTRDLELLCSIEVLLLCQGMPGGVLSKTGDLDNRLKTLFDALSMPREQTQVGIFATPDKDEVPFFCLLEDDSVITKAAVESDTLLQAVSNPPNEQDVHVTITVKIRPGRVFSSNIGFM